MASESESSRNANLYKNESIKFRYRLDTVLHLILCDLNQAAIALLLHHWVEAVSSDPGVELEILKLDSVLWFLLQHPA